MLTRVHSVIHTLIHTLVLVQPRTKSSILLGSFDQGRGHKASLMFVTHTALEHQSPSPLSTPGARCWGIVEIGVRQPWFIATLEMPGDIRHLDLLIANEVDLCDLLDSEIGEIKALQIVVPERQYVWQMRSIAKVWRHVAANGCEQWMFDDVCGARTFCPPLNVSKRNSKDPGTLVLDFT